MFWKEDCYIPDQFMKTMGECQKQGKDTISQNDTWREVHCQPDGKSKCVLFEICETIHISEPEEREE